MFLHTGPETRDRPALITMDGGALSHGDLARLVAATARMFGHRRKLLVSVFGERELATVAAYLAALDGQHACALHEVTASAAAQQKHIDAYQPEVVVYGPGATDMWAVRSPHYAWRGTLPAGGTMFARTVESDGDIFDGTALLLATSGSTGSPQTVRLSRGNLESNAAAIVSALGIGADDRGVTSLPLHYCYGLSVLNTHLLAGGSVLLSADSPTAQAFWHRAGRHGCTNVAGVHTTYELLHRGRVDLDRAPSLRMLTQSGGRLANDVAVHFARLMDKRAGRFVVMYGQTEATARLSCLPHEQLEPHLGSVGHAVPGGRFWIEDDDRRPCPDGVVGNVMYAGPNVMLGYADRRADLANGDVMRGVLATGDRGLLKDGFLYLTGRSKRIAKLHGRRINLDDIEGMAGPVGAAAAVSTADRFITIFIVGDPGRFRALRERLAGELRLPRATIRIVPVDKLPMLSNGKVDYPALQRL